MLFLTHLMLSIFLQLTYGSFAPDEIQSIEGPPFYCMVPNENLQYKGIICLLQHFRWTWVGLFVVEDKSGEQFLKILETLFSRHGICSAFTKRIPQAARLEELLNHFHDTNLISASYTDDKANANIVYGDPVTVLWLRTFLGSQDSGNNENGLFGKVWIMTTQIEFVLSGISRGLDFQMFQGAISFKIHTKEVPGFRRFLQNIKPKRTQGDGFLKDFWEQAFDCLLPDPGMPAMDNDTCTGEERLESLPAGLFEMHLSGLGYSIYNAVYVIAHALHAMYSSRSRHRPTVVGSSVDVQPLQAWQVIAPQQNLLDTMNRLINTSGAYIHYFFYLRNLGLNSQKNYSYVSKCIKFRYCKLYETISSTLSSEMRVTETKETVIFPSCLK
uniref:Receptor ligand binding region domain-containing protein n=1 Tax=Podarcis muralis TaxID=64176 RepID=A0A670K7K5_PODMU